MWRDIIFFFSFSQESSKQSDDLSKIKKYFANENKNVRKYKKPSKI